MNRSTLISLFLITLISLYGVKALFHPGFYTSHDGEHQVLRLYHFDKAIKDGQIPPRWANYQILNGHGYPLFNFSYHAPWIMAEPLRLIGLSLTNTVKLMFVFTFLLSGLSMFFWLKELFAEFPAFVGGILYLWAPYRFSNIFVRASLGEATVFMFVPMIFYGLEKIKAKNSFIAVVVGAIGVGGLILSHALASFVFVLPILLYLLTSLFLSTRKKVYFRAPEASGARKDGRCRLLGTQPFHRQGGRHFLKASLLFLLGFSLSAYYLLPAFFEKKFTKFSLMYPSMFADHFVTLKQLIYSRWGYGFSFPGVENDDMAFQIGVAHWLSIFFAICLMAILIFLMKRKKFDKRPFLLGVCLFLSFCFSILMMLKASEPLWRCVVRFVPYDFPWRFLGLAVFSSSFLATWLTFYLRKLKKKKVALFLSLILIGLTFYANRNHLRVNQYLDHDEEYYEKITNSTSSYDELVPIWAKSEFFEQKSDLIEILKGEVDLENVKRKSDKISFTANTKDQDALLRITTLFFPGWKLFVNGKEREFNYQNSGMIEFKAPRGRSQVLLIFTKTPVRVLADVISFSALVFLALWNLKFRWR